MSSNSPVGPAEYASLLSSFGIDQYLRVRRSGSRSPIDYKSLRAEQDRAFARDMADTAKRLLSEGKEREAVEEFSRSIGFCETVEALLGRAVVYRSMRRFDGCTRDYNRVLDIDPDNAEALNYFGSIRRSNAASLLPLHRSGGLRRVVDGADVLNEHASDSPGSQASTEARRHRKHKKHKKHKKHRKRGRDEDPGDGRSQGL